MITTAPHHYSTHPSIPGTLLGMHMQCRPTTASETEISMIPDAPPCSRNLDCSGRRESPDLFSLGSLSDSLILPHRLRRLQRRYRWDLRNSIFPRRSSAVPDRQCCSHTLSPCAYSVMCARSLQVIKCLQRSDTAIYSNSPNTAMLA